MMHAVTTIRHSFVSTFTLSLVIAASVLALTGCGGGGGSNQESRANNDGGQGSSATTANVDGRAIRVGFSQIGAESAWRTAETESIRNEAEQRGINLNIADGANDQARQIQSLRSFISQDVDAIILAPVVKTGWDPVLREIKEAGIPVVLVDRGIETSDPSLYATLVAADFVEEGRQAAQWLIETTGGEASIVELLGTTGSDPASDRSRGFREVIAQHSTMRIIRAQDGDFRRENGKRIMETILKAEPPGAITAVYAHNDDMALGAIQAIEEAGLKPGIDVHVVSIDGIRDAVESVANGKLGCTIECNPLLGPLAFDAVERLLAGESVESRTVVPYRVFTQPEAEAALPTRQY